MIFLFVHEHPVTVFNAAEQNWRCISSLAISGVKQQSKNVYITINKLRTDILILST